MKKIKPVVLKDATKLTNSQMKQIRGGYDPGNNRSSSCIIPCPVGFGGGSVEPECLGTSYCDIYSGVNSDGTPFYGAACYTPGNSNPTHEIKLCELAESMK